MHAINTRNADLVAGEVALMRERGAGQRELRPGAHVGDCPLQRCPQHRATLLLAPSSSSIMSGS